MDTPKKYINKFWTIIAVVSAICTPTIIAFAVKDAGGMISYYCTAGNPFFGLHLEGYALCSVWVTIGFSLACILGVMLGLFILAVIFDILKLIFYPMILRRKKVFIVSITKEEFEQRLYAFISRDIALSLGLLDWKELYYGANVVSDINEAISIRILEGEYRGLILRMSKNPDGLEISISNAPYHISKTNSYMKLLKWLRSLQKRVI